MMNKKIIPAKEFVEEAKIIIAKQKKIKDAWGELYEKYKDRISLIDGYIHHRSDKVYNECKSLFEISFHPHYVSIFRPKSLQGIENNNGWIKIEDQLPDESIEVLFFNEKWIDEDFNPFGTRIGFYNNEDFTTAYYWNYQDTYITISHSDCDDDEGFSNEIKNSIEPTHWKYVNDKPPIF